MNEGVSNITLDKNVRLPALTVFLRLPGFEVVNPIVDVFLLNASAASVIVYSPKTCTCPFDKCLNVRHIPINYMHE